MKNDIIRQLYERYYNSLMVIALSYTHDRSAAEDLVQETFLKAMLSYKEGGSFLYWCNRVLRNSFYNMARQNQNIADVAIGDLEIDSGADVLGAYIKTEQRREMAAMIASLPMKYREVMIDSVYLEMEDEQIARALGTSKENIRQIRSRAKKQLKKLKEERENTTRRT